ncbi:hypothetical protein KP509_14G067900 [Ceratopteris richardii]|nr:hypothetical protein KP509_14G067900 [Ceratopteris richardii]
MAVISMNFSGDGKSGAEQSAFPCLNEDVIDTSNGDHLKSFTLGKVIQELSVLSEPPSINGLICIFQIFRRGTPEHSKLLYTHLCKFGLEAQKIVGNRVAQVLAHCGCVFMAQQVLSRLRHHNIYTWTCVMLGFVQSGEAHNAINLYEKMCEIGLHPSKHTLVTLLKACTQLKNLRIGQEINDCIVQRGLDMDLFVGSSLVDIYAKCGLLIDAIRIFEMMVSHNTVSWSSLIAAYTEHGLAEDALDCFRRMEDQRLSPDEVTFVSVVKSCGLLQVRERTFEVCHEIIVRGYDRGRIIANSVVDMYAKCGMIAEATAVFNKIAVRDAFSWTALINAYSKYGTNEELLLRFEEMQLEGVCPDAAIFASVIKACSSLGDIETGRRIHRVAEEKQMHTELFVCSSLVDMYCKHGFLLEAQDAFDKLPSRDLVSWNALLAGYAEHGPGRKVISSFYRMQAEGVPQNPVTFLCALKACGNMGAVEIGREVHLECTLKAFDRDISVGSTLLDMYGKIGLLSEALYIFHSLHMRDVVSWNAIIKAHGINQAGDIAVELFKCMEESGAKPDNATLTCLLTACSRSSLLQKGQRLFSIITSEHGVAATREHVACMVDLVARSGQMEEAWKVLKCLPHFPADQGLRALLSSCKTHTEQAMGIACYQKLVDLNPNCAAPYLLLSDICCRLGNWELAQRLEALRKAKQAKERPACAMIEVRKQVYEFIVGDTECIAYVHYLGTLRSRTVKYGHIPDLDGILMRHN